MIGGDEGDELVEARNRIRELELQLSAGAVPEWVTLRFRLDQAELVRGRERIAELEREVERLQDRAARAEGRASSAEYLLEHQSQAIGGGLAGLWHSVLSRLGGLLPARVWRAPATTLEGNGPVVPGSWVGVDEPKAPTPPNQLRALPGEADAVASAAGRPSPPRSRKPRAR
jgi:hypothetical protein